LEFVKIGKKTVEMLITIMENKKIWMLKMTLSSFKSMEIFKFPTVWQLASCLNLGMKWKKSLSLKNVRTTLKSFDGKKYLQNFFSAGNLWEIFETFFYFFGKSKFS